ncbi:MAG: peptidylprolyl isomerase [Geminicoccaceae bacterium]
MLRIAGLAALALAIAANTALADNPRVRLDTNKGPITLELYADQAPKTVENFLNYVQSDFYDGTIFHRVIDGFMIQGGGFTPDFSQKATNAPVMNEADNGLSNDRGTVAMARTSDPHSATAQFFINVVDNDFLDHTAPTARGWGYAVFGEVIEGMETVDTIAGSPTGADGPFPTDVPAEQVVIEDAALLE